jgi:hypothetical protein
MVTPCAQEWSPIANGIGPAMRFLERDRAHTVDTVGRVPRRKPGVIAFRFGAPVEVEIRPRSEPIGGAIDRF